MGIAQNQYPRAALSRIVKPARPRTPRNAQNRLGTADGPNERPIRPSQLRQRRRLFPHAATQARELGGTSTLAPRRGKLVKQPPRTIPGSALHRIVNRYDSQIDSLSLELHRTELAVFRERFDKERVIGELLDAETTLTNERSKRHHLENRMKEVVKVAEGLYFDSVIPLADSETDSFELDTRETLPELLRRIRTRVQTLHAYHARDFNTIGDLQRELEDMRETFVERELRWYHERQPALRTLSLLQELQLEYGMALWRQRGMELQLLSAHRELDALSDHSEAYRREIGHTEKQAAYIKELELRLRSVEESVRKTVMILVQPKGRLGGSLVELEQSGEESEEGVKEQSDDVIEGHRTSRQSKGESYQSTATAVSQTKSTPTSTHSPRKSVHFKLDDCDLSTASTSDASASPRME
ncbi:hypothetical protein FRC04_001363 [Tulasnella sp. 424]|nr:hypothetical protein FRC04_001363 [Tulasnella sp. 424]